MKVTVAATQMTCSWEIEENITKAKKIINDAANKGANIILLQELFQTPYFCIEYDEEIFRLAKPFDDNTLLKEMSDIAKKLQVVLPISYFEKDKNAIGNGGVGEITKELQKSFMNIVMGKDKRFVRWLTYL